MKKIFRFICLISLCFGFMSCATTISYKVVRPAEMDLRGANSICLLSFRPSLRSSFSSVRIGDRRSARDFFERSYDLRYAETDIIDHIFDELESNLKDSEYIKYVDNKQIRTAYRNGDLYSACDICLTGEIIEYSVNDEKIVTKKEIEVEDTKRPVDDSVYSKPKTKKKIVYEDSYKRHVTLRFEYEVVDLSDETIIFTKEAKLTDSSASYKDPYSLPDAFGLIRYDLNNKLESIVKEVVPYNEYKSLKLLKGKSEKNLMKQAAEYAEVGNYESAYKIFYPLYTNDKVFEAGYNAALVLEAAGKLVAAEELMKDVYVTSESKKAKKALADIQEEIRLATKLKGQLEEQRARELTEDWHSVEID